MTARSCSTARRQARLIRQPSCGNEPGTFRIRNPFEHPAGFSGLLDNRTGDGGAGVT